MKKIICLMANLGFGGAEVQSVLLLNGLFRNGYTIEVIVLDDERIQLACRLEPGIGTIFLHRNAFLDPAVLLRIRKLVLAGQPDALLLVDSYPVMYGILLKKLFRIRLRCLSIIHNTVPADFKAAVQNRLIFAPALRRLGEVVFVSQKQQGYWMSRYGIREKDSHVILNGIEVARFSRYARDNSARECRSKLGIPVELPVIAMNASLWAAKRHEDMIEAVSLLLEEGMEVFLLIIGDGPRRKVLEELIRERGLQERVRITGYLEDVRPVLMCADVSALTSTSVETLSMAALESMAMGKMLILSDTGGAAEIVDHGVNGYLYPPGNVRALVESIRRLVGSGNCRQMGDAALEKAERQFTAERMLQEYVRLLEMESIR